MKMCLSRRLRAVASLVRGKVIADVGCDTANLAIWLAQNCDVFVYACDLRTKPLERARANLKKFEVNSKVKLIRSDGLNNVPNCVDEVIISGLGGLAIEKIVLNCKWLKYLKIPLILQPQNCCFRLKVQLISNGFKLIKQVFVVEKGKAYEVCVFEFFGVKQKLNFKQFMFSEHVVVNEDLFKYVFLKKEKCVQILNCLNMAKKGADVAKKKCFYSQFLKFLKELEVKYKL